MWGGNKASFQLYSEEQKVFLTFWFNKNWDRYWIKIAYILHCLVLKNIIHIRTGWIFIFLSKWGLEEKCIVHWLNFLHLFNIIVLKFLFYILFLNVYFFTKIIGICVYLQVTYFCILNSLSLAHAVQFVLTMIENQS